MNTKNQFDAMTRNYAKSVQEFLKDNSMYFTHMPNGFRVNYIETDKAVNISLYQDKTLEPQSSKTSDNG